MKLQSYLRLLALPLLLASCGEFFEFGEGKIPDKSNIQVTNREITVMAGDSCRVMYILQQDEDVSQALYWESKDQNVCTVSPLGMVKGVAAGKANVMVMVLADLQRDSASVTVLPLWEVSPYAYPYEMVVYADVTVGGVAAGDDCIVGAFIGDEVRGVGVAHTVGELRYTELRVYGSMSDESDAEVTFKCYRRGMGMVQDFTQKLTFDGSTHGTLSDLFKLSI